MRKFYGLWSKNFQHITSFENHWMGSLVCSGNRGHSHDDALAFHMKKVQFCSIEAIEHVSQMAFILYLEKHHVLRLSFIFPMKLYHKGGYAWIFSKNLIFKFSINLYSANLIKLNKLLHHPHILIQYQVHSSTIWTKIERHAMWTFNLLSILQPVAKSNCESFIEHTNECLS